MKAIFSYFSWPQISSSLHCTMFSEHISYHFSSVSQSPLRQSSDRIDSSLNWNIGHTDFLSTINVICEFFTQTKYGLKIKINSFNVQSVLSHYSSWVLLLNHLKFSKFVWLYLDGGCKQPARRCWARTDLRLLGKLSSMTGLHRATLHFFLSSGPVTKEWFRK